MIRSIRHLVQALCQSLIEIVNLLKTSNIVAHHYQKGPLLCSNLGSFTHKPAT